MNTISAADIKRCGLAAVDRAIAHGDVHVVRDQSPEYVVLSEERYQNLVEEAQETHVNRVRSDGDAVPRKRSGKFSRTEDLLKALEREEHGVPATEVTPQRSR